MNKTLAISYLRVSGKGQVGGDGLPRQREAIARYARQHNVLLAGEYRDEGVSGTRELDGRDGLSDVMARLRANGVRLVLVENASRLARDLMVSEIILREFRELRRVFFFELVEKSLCGFGIGKRLYQCFRYSHRRNRFVSIPYFLIL